MARQVQAVEPPEPGTYERVLRRTDRDPALPWRFATYDVSLTARPIRMHGVLAPTLFFPPGRGTAADRAMKLGWRDVTKEWGQWLLHGDAPPPPQVLTGEELRAWLGRISWNALRVALKPYMPTGGNWMALGREKLEREGAVLIDAAGGMPVSEAAQYSMKKEHPVVEREVPAEAG